MSTPADASPDMPDGRDPVHIRSPFLLFLGESTSRPDCKTAVGIAHWRPEKCVGVLSLANAASGERPTDLPEMSVEAAAQAGARTLVIGTVSAGGFLPDSWMPTLLEATRAGMDIASGMHQRLTAHPGLRSAAAQAGTRLLDVRDPELWQAGKPWRVGTGERRAGRRILTVGTDCNIGKMYAALALERGLREAGENSEFKATGQTGILIEGHGVPVDAVVSDFIAGAIEALSPSDPEAVHVIEGQGSLHHPAYAGVSLGLLHGAQPDGLVICHEPTRAHMRHVPHLKPPTLAETAELNLLHARRTNPDVRVIGFSVNTSLLDDVLARDLLWEIEDEFSLPAVDPIRTGVDGLVESWQKG